MIKNNLKTEILKIVINSYTIYNITMPSLNFDFFKFQDIEIEEGIQKYYIHKY